MNKEFVSYEQALALKELGFDEPCMCIYDKDRKLERSLIEYPIINSKNGFHDFWNIITAPLYQQAFRWFREKYQLTSWVYNSNTDKFFYTILQDGRIVKSQKSSITYEEAELACLNKLIEIVKGGKQ